MNIIPEKQVVSIQRRALAAGLILGMTTLFLGVVFGSASVNVTATVGSTITCNSASTSTLAFGTLTSASVFFTSPANVSTTISCNDGAGCVLNLNDLGSSTAAGLYATGTANYVIKSPNAAVSVTSTIAAGTEGYGIVATTTAAGAGGTLTLNPRYNFTTSSAIIGGLTTTTLVLASTTSAITTAREVLTYPEAAIAATTAGGSYNDTLTYGCAGN